mgnify:CR=1 FL=1
MLYYNKTANLAKQMMVQDTDKFFNAFLQGNTSCILPSIRDLATRNQNLAYNLAAEVYKIFVGKKWMKPSDWSTKYYTLVAYGFLMCDLAFIYNPDNEKFELHTASVSMVQKLASQGYIEGATKKDAAELSVQKAVDALSGDKKILTSLKKDNVIQTVRLDPSMNGRDLKFKITVPRSQVDIVKTMIVPFTCYMQVIKDLQALFGRGFIRVTMNEGEKVRVVTLNQELLSKIYTPERVSQLSGFTPNAYMKSFYVPSVGASVYSLGVTNIKPETIDKLEMINLRDIDLSEVNVDYTMVRPYFIQQLKGLNLQQLKTLIKNLAIPVTDAGFTRSKTGCISILENWVYTSQDAKAYESNLYTLMKESPFFDISGLSNMQNTYGNMMQQVSYPGSPAGLSQLLNTGVFRITTRRRAGSMSTHIVTNNHTELKRILGDDYFVKFESYGVRLNYAMNLVVAMGKKYGSKTPLKGESDIYTKLSEFGIYLPDEDKEKMLTYEDLYAFLNKTKADEVDANKTVVSQAHLVVARNCQAWYSPEEDKPYDYYKNIDPNSIVSIIRLSNVGGN